MGILTLFHIMEDKFKNFKPEDLEFCPYDMLELLKPQFWDQGTQVTTQTGEEFQKQVNTKYRKLSLKYHPDRDRGQVKDPRRVQLFMWIKEASLILLNQRAK